LLGQNGAGKTTLLKLLLGLLRPQSGSISVLEQSPQKPGIFHHIGNVIEGPHLYHHLTGRQNLELFVHYRQLDSKNIDRVLGLTEMTAQADKRVGHYSTGMKQRLAIAQALLHDPRLLILDEPTNGLDPEGIADIRKLILQLAQDEDKTIIFSSHIRSEVEQVSTHIGVLKDTKLLFQGGYQDLRKRMGTGEQVLFTIDSPQEGYRLMQKKGYEVEKKGNKLKVSVPEPKAISALIDELRREKMEIYRIESTENPLEQFFLSLHKKQRK